MARIKQLSKHLINQIAAGEVIERPASVVKELVENSVDAGASKISVEISNECRDIRVADNGSGIHPDDIMLAFSKHATSKISTDEDLFAIDTLGFRGEALASIISIAKVTCTTRTKDFETGTKVKCENSEVKKVETGCAVGTIMEVRDLFYNIPARLKFLKNPNTEFSYIQELVQAIAISHPKISFELKKNGKTVLKTSGSNELKHALKELFSNSITDNLKEVLKTDELADLKISGYVSTPDFTRSSKKDYHIYINSRTVKCPVFMKAIDTAYKNLMANGKYPFVVLNLELVAFGKIDSIAYPDTAAGGELRHHIFIGPSGVTVEVSLYSPYRLIGIRIRIGIGFGIGLRVIAAHRLAVVGCAEAVGRILPVIEVEVEAVLSGLKGDITTTNILSTFYLTGTKPGAAVVEDKLEAVSSARLIYVYIHIEFAVAADLFHRCGVGCPSVERTSDSHKVKALNHVESQR